MPVRHTGPTTGALVARGAVGMFVLKVAYSSLGFLLGIVLARALGVAGYGRYNYAMSWAVFLGAPAALGFDKLVVRQVAIDRSRGDWRDLRSWLRTANRAGLFASAALIVVAALVALGAGLSGHADAAATVAIALLLVPILTLMKVRQAALSGLGHVVQGQWPELLLHPAVVIGVVGGWWIAGRAVSAEAAMGVTVASSALMLILGAWLLRERLPDEARQTRAGRIDLPWRASVAPLVAMATILALQGQADVLLLGLLAPPAMVGVYGAASRGALLVVFFLNAALPALSPAVAELHAAGKRDELERVVVTMARTTTLLSLPVAVGLMVFGRWYLAIFGHAFVEGIVPLAILCVGQIVNVCCGPVGTVLIMAGHERVVVRIVGMSAAINLAVSAALIPTFGPVGAAIGAASSMALWNVLMVREVRLRVGIESTCFSRIRRYDPASS
jgi:O-antigen/teichoic acid export membrane protein